MHYIFSINPNANHGHAMTYLNQIDAFASTRHINHSIVMPRSLSEMQSIVATVHEDDIFVIIGGDGSIHHAINALKSHGTFAVIPFGTGNDFYRMIHSKRPTSIEQAIDGILMGNAKAIDAAKIDSDGTTKLFINNVSFGLDAYVNEYVCDHMKHSLFPQSFYYPFGALLGIMKYPSYGLIIDSKPDWPKKATLCYIGNGSYYGSGFHPTPWSKLDDGKLDLVLIDALTKTQMLPLILKYRNGTYSNLPQAHIETIEHVSIHFDDKIVAHVDGEPFYCHNVTIDVLPHQFNVVIPRFSE